MVEVTKKYYRCIHISSHWSLRWPSQLQCYFCDGVMKTAYYASKALHLTQSHLICMDVKYVEIWKCTVTNWAMLLLRGLSLYTISVGLSRLVGTCCCCFFCQLDPLAAIYSCLNESSGITTGEALGAAAKVCRKYIYVITLPPYGSKWGVYPYVGGGNIDRECLKCSLGWYSDIFIHVKFEYY